MEKINLNQNWMAWKDTNPFELVVSVPPYAEAVDLPDDVMLREEQREDAVNDGSTGYIDAGAYKYSKTVFIPEDWRGERIKLHFGGVYRNAAVYVNQSLVGMEADGYSEFTVRIDNYVKFGEENVILVTVKCGTQNSRWYSGAGIFRDVTLLHGGPVRIASESLRLTTLGIDRHENSAEAAESDATVKAVAETAVHDIADATVQITADIVNGDLTAKTVMTRFCIVDADGKAAAEGAYPVRIQAGQQVEFRKTVYIENARLWDDEHPNLYKVHFSVEDIGASGSKEDVPACKQDRDTITTGIRTLTVDARHGLRVNGRTVKLRGGCIHHDESLLGGAAWEDYEYRRVKRMKEAGFNAVRSAHNHASQALLNACDRLGFYVMDELTDAWNKAKTVYDVSMSFEAEWGENVASMVRADYNHPSVVLYSTGNEISEIATEKGIELSRALGDAFHRLDPTRFTTNGINGAFAAGDALADIVMDITGKRPGPGDVNVFMAALANQMAEITKHQVLTDLLQKLETTMDILGYNYMTARYVKDAKDYPNRVMVGSETNPKMIAENWDIIMKIPAIIGEFTWTGWDDMGEVGHGTYPRLMSPCGDISAIGIRRAMSYYREIVFGLKKTPVIAVQDPARFGISRDFGPWQYTDCVFNYTWPGQEGKPVYIEVYAGGDETELFLNGKSLGRKPCGKDTAFAAQFETVYEPGELEAVAYENGEEIGRSVLQTTGEAAKLALAPECGEDLIFVNIELQDDKGRRVFSDAELEIDVKGAALLGFGSERTKHDHGYTKPKATATDGCALAILRPERKNGGEEVTVTVKCGELSAALMI